jgi:hypothetical protein
VESVRGTVAFGVFCGGVLLCADALLGFRIVGVPESETVISSAADDFADEVQPQFEVGDPEARFTMALVDPPEKTISAGEGIVGLFLGREVVINPAYTSGCLAGTAYDSKSDTVQATEVEIPVYGGETESGIQVTAPDADPLLFTNDSHDLMDFEPADGTTWHVLETNECPTTHERYL